MNREQQRGSSTLRGRGRSSSRGAGVKHSSRGRSESCGSRYSVRTRSSASTLDSSPRSRNETNNITVRPIIKKKTLAERINSKRTSNSPLRPSSSSTPVTSPQGTATNENHNPSSEFNNQNNSNDQPPLVPKQPYLNSLVDLENNLNEYQTTPLLSSAGTALVSNLERLPVITALSSISEVNNFLDILGCHIDDYGNNLQTHPNWKKSIYERYNEVMIDLNKARDIAADLMSNAALTRCSDLSSKLEDFKVRWSLSTSSHSTSSFHGFQSLVSNGSSMKMKRNENLPQIHQDDLSSFQKRLSSLESNLSGLNHLRDKLPNLYQRVAVLEDKDENSDNKIKLIVEENNENSSTEILELKDKVIKIDSDLSHLKESFKNHLEICNKKTYLNIFQKLEDLESKQTVPTDISTNYLRALSKEFAAFQRSMSIDIQNIRDSFSELPKNTNDQHKPESISNIKGIEPLVDKFCTKSLPDDHVTESVSRWLHSQIRLSGDSSANQHVKPDCNSCNAQVVTSRNNNPFNIPANNYIPNAEHENLIDLTSPLKTMKISNHNKVQSKEHRDNLDNTSESSQLTNSTISPSSVQGKILKTSMKNLSRLLIPKVSDKIGKSTLQDLYRNQLSTVESQVRDISRSLRDYMKSNDHNIQLCENVSNVIEQASDWAAEIRILYHKLGIHKKSQASKLYDSLPQFTKHSQIDVFEFFRRFSAFSEEYDIPEERATLLFNKFLSSDIQEEVEEFKDDFSEMKKALTHRYGDLKTITSDFLLPVSKSTKPSNHNDSIAYLDYYRRLNSSLQKINNLLISKNVPMDEAESYIYSQDFLHLLLSFMPHDSKSKFLEQMQFFGEDTIRIRGQTAFKLILKTVSQSYQLYDASARTDIPPLSVGKARKAKSHQINHSSGVPITNDSDSDRERELTSSIHYQSSSTAKTRNDRPLSSFKFPCIIEKHNHELQDCRDFFFSTPKTRYEERRSFKFKHCLLCLQSSENCKSRRCNNNKSVPKSLICPECQEESKTNKKKSWVSVFFCTNDKHSKPSNPDILKALESYLPSFKSGNLNAPISLVSHFQVLATSISEPKPTSLSRLPDVQEQPLVYNTSSGCIDNPPPIDMIPEILEDSIAVMQLLLIKDTPVLALYDRGANQHLIEGKIAEELKIKVINHQPSAIGVVSGGKIWTEYGTYQMYLGPTTEGKYIELIAQGITAVTTTIPSYNLDDVNKETLETTDIPLETQLPQYIGGSRIGLLIGLKNPDLEPVCVFTLPSGIGLYKSPFKDMFGSYYCYGGPHSLFSKVNKKFHGSINHIQAYFTQTMNQYRNSLYPSLLDSLKPELTETESCISNFVEPKLDYCFYSKSGRDVYPTPLNSSDFTELGQHVSDERDQDRNLCSNLHCDCASTLNVLKAHVPLSKQRLYIDEIDVDNIISFRCEVCRKCKCSSSNRSKMISLQEQMEQDIIDKSVTIDLQNQQVLVDLPFISDPDKILSAKHGGNNNYNQARKVYNSVCKSSSDETKVMIRTAHEDLVNKGFMKKITDLPQDQQDMINNSKFCHFMPWRAVLKESSSTPLRMVVDPSMTGLNLCLAKGENKMKKITDILCRARTKRFIFTSDISKLYNRLKLKPSSYRYQLFLFHDELNPNSDPEIYIMMCAWYGVTSSANQSFVALEKLATLLKEKYPLAYTIIVVDTYVDDIMSGSDELQECEEMIKQVVAVLEAGGFVAKFVIQSGAILDEPFVKVLGYKWLVTEDKISPGFSEINFQKKRRGLKGPNPFPVKTPEDVVKLLSDKNITRRMIVSMIAQVWDPSGYWEPYKLQLKLDSQCLNGMQWDVPLCIEMQEYWISRFQEFLSIPSLKLSRYIFPDNTVDDSIRLICISDAAECAGGGAIYAGKKCEDGSYSCSLLAAKSKLMSNSIPRNELEAIRIAAELALEVKQALGSRVVEIVYVTDSSIAMSWVHNTKKRLRLFCLNRVMEIRRLISEATDQLISVPLFHCEGKSNPADLLTKPNSLKPKDLHNSSIWACGYEWMKLLTNDMPLTTYKDLCLSATQSNLIDEECYPEIHFPSSVNHFLINNSDSQYHCEGCQMFQGYVSINVCHGCSKSNPHCVNCSCKVSMLTLALKRDENYPLIDIIFTGYQKSLRIMANVYDFILLIKHKMHQREGKPISIECQMCQAIQISNGIPSEYCKILRAKALSYFLKIESSKLADSVSKDQLRSYKFKEGIYYSVSRIPEDARIEQKDLDYDVFFDNTELQSVLPVVSPDSNFFFALLMHVHHNVRKHSGNEITLREIMKVIYPSSNPKRIIQAVRKNCPRCRLILRKTLELEIGNHPQSRFQIVPAFYHTMCDIVYGFSAKPFKNSRTNIKIYALVLVCLLTSATSIVALEGLETQDVVMALERHSSRHGIPSVLFIDQGTQLLGLKNLLVTIRNANLQLKESLGIEIVPSTAKAHSSQGRVERKIRTLRDMLKKTSVNVEHSLTPIQWETIFCKMASEIDDIPIAIGDKSSSADFGWQILTPNRFKLGRSNNFAVEGVMRIAESSCPSQLLKRLQAIQSYWYQLLIDRMHHLIPKPDRWNKSDIININDIVSFRFKDNESSKMEKWKIGKVVEIFKGGRSVKLVYSHAVPGKPNPKMLFVERSIRDVCVISAISDLNLNSEEFFNHFKQIS